MAPFLRAIGVSFVLTALGLAPAGAADKPKMLAIEGEVRLSADQAGAVAPGDRLVFKLFHPHEGVEKDVRYWIKDEFAFPQAFRLAPTVDMTGNPRRNTYILEVFTDKDRKVLNRVDGELHTAIGEPVPLGTTGLVLELAAPE